MAPIRPRVVGIEALARDEAVRFRVAFQELHHLVIRGAVDGVCRKDIDDEGPAWAKVVERRGQACRPGLCVRQQQQGVERGDDHVELRIELELCHVAAGERQAGCGFRIQQLALGARARQHAL